MSNKVDKLRQYGFKVQWVRSDIKDDTTHTYGYHGYIGPYDANDHTPDKGDLPYVNLECVAKGEDGANQTYTSERSNYRSLRRDYPDIWTDTSYSNVDVLGAFVADLPDEVIDILIHLKNEYHLYDEDDCSSLEDEEISDSWDQYVRSDLQSILIKWDLETEWDALGDDAEKSLFWRCVKESDSYPEHNGLDISWHLDKIADRMEQYLRGYIDIIPDNQLALDI